jgi:hypothetical protein
MVVRNGQQGEGDSHHFGAKLVRSEGAKRRARDEEERDEG